MAFKDNTVDISKLKIADITVGDLHDIIAVLECSVAHLLLPDEAAAALRRLIEKARP